MDTMEQVIERLDETEKKAGDVIRRLEEAEDLHKSLDESRKGLEVLAVEVKKLITTTRKGVDDLGEVVTALKTATETIQQSDPGVITATLRTMEARIETIAGEVSAITEIKADMAGLEERTRAMIGNAVDEISGQSLMDRVRGTRRNTKPERHT